MELFEKNLFITLSLLFGVKVANENLRSQLINLLNVFYRLWVILFCNSFLQSNHVVDGGSSGMFLTPLIEIIDIGLRLAFAEDFSTVDDNFTAL